jgi:pyruvate formate lyase activating enzyme
MCNVNDVEPIYQSLLEYKKNNVYTEITNLLVPKYGDDMKDFRKLCKWIVDNMGVMTPLHILQFFPTFNASNIPKTAIEKLERAYNIAKEEGMNYVYLGNVPGHNLENTFCHNCGELLIERSIQGTRKMHMREDLICPNCKEHIPIFGQKWTPKSLWVKI